MFNGAPSTNGWMLVKEAKPDCDDVAKQVLGRQVYKFTSNTGELLRSLLKQRYIKYLDKIMRSEKNVPYNYMQKCLSEFGCHFTKNNHTEPTFGRMQEKSIIYDFHSSGF